MLRFAVSVVVAVLLAACGHGGREPAPPVQPTTAAVNGRDVVIGIVVPSAPGGHPLVQRDAERLLQERGGNAGPHHVQLLFANLWMTKGGPDPCIDADRQVRDAAVVATVVEGSGCAREMRTNLPAADPPLLVTPAAAPGVASADPAVLRVGVTWADEGEAAARYATTVLGRKRCVVLDDGEMIGQDARFRFAQAAGAALAGAATWDGRVKNYRPFLRALSPLRPDCIFLAGIADQNGLRLIADAVAVFGPAGGPVRVLAGSGFIGYSEAWTGAEQGLTLVSDEIAADEQSGAVRDATAVAGVPAQLAALDVVLDAIARSDGTRAGVAHAAFAATPVQTPIGSLAFDPATGEQLDPQVGIWQIRGVEERFVQTFPLR